ncbi:MAG: cobalamin-binding protein [Pirellulales bacterium]
MPSPPRIVSLVPSGTEALFALGLGAQVVGVSHACDWPPAAGLLPRLTRTRVDGGAPGQAIDDQVRDLLAAGEPLYDVDLRLLEELTPTLIVTQSQCEVCAVHYDDVIGWVESSPRLRSAQVLGLNPRRLDDALEDVARIAVAAGAELAGDALVARLRGRIQKVAQQVAGAPRVRVACLEWLEPPMLAGNWGPELVHLAGGVQPLTTAGEHSRYVDWPQIAAADPEVMVVCPCGFGLERAVVEARALTRIEGWGGLSAVTAGRVFALDGNAYFNRPGPRLVDTLELLAHLLHPDLCAAPVGGCWQAVGA